MARRISGIWQASLVAVLGFVVDLQCAEFPGCHCPCGDGPRVAVEYEYMDHGGTTPKPTPRRGHLRNLTRVNDKV